MDTYLENYALLSDMHTSALVSRQGSIDWLCLPRFDSASVFSKLIGDQDDGSWRVFVEDGEVVEWAYEPNTFVLVTTWRSPTGVAKVTDFLPTMGKNADLMRIVECVEGEVVVTHDLRVRFDYARSTPWFRRVELESGGWQLETLAGPDGIVFRGPLLRPMKENGEGSADDLRRDEHDLLDKGGHQCSRLGGTFRLSAGQREVWDLAWFPSYADPPEPQDSHRALQATRDYWASWASRLTTESKYKEDITRSLLVLRALTHLETGGIVAAPTTSLPEYFGGERNWDYRYTWLRDAALTIEALVAHDFTEGATQWRDWLLRAIAGDVDDLRIMYGIGGERDLDEKEMDHFRGYEDSRPVRIGNAAAPQFQADVPGEVMIALAHLRDSGVEDNEYTWALQCGILQYCEKNLNRKDQGVWEMRGDKHFFTHGRIMMWAAFNEGIRAVEKYGLPGDVETWTRLRDELREEILTHGYDEERGTFTQTYDNDEVDASLLQIPHTRFLPYDDERMLGTVKAIEEDLIEDEWLVHRYRTEAGFDGLEGEEYPFLMCSFWLVEQYALSGREEEAEKMMDYLLSLSGDLGLFSEEYDPETKRLAGNFPQAFSHLALVQAADAIDGTPRLS